MMRQIIKYGSIPGIILAISMILTFSLTDPHQNMQGSQIFGYSMMILAVSPAMVFGLRKFDPAGAEKFGRRFLLCLGIAAVSSLLYVLGWAITNHFIVPGFMDNMIDLYKKMYEKGSISKDDLEFAQFAAQHYSNPLWFTLFTLMEIFPVTLLLALIIPPVMKLFQRKKAA